MFMHTQSIGSSNNDYTFEYSFLVVIPAINHINIFSLFLLINTISSLIPYLLLFLSGDIDSKLTFLPDLMKIAHEGLIAYRILLPRHHYPSVSSTELVTAIRDNGGIDQVRELLKSESSNFKLPGDYKLAEPRFDRLPPISVSTNSYRVFHERRLPDQDFFAAFDDVSDTDAIMQILLLHEDKEALGHLPFAGIVSDDSILIRRRDWRRFYMTITSKDLLKALLIYGSRGIGESVFLNILVLLFLRAGYVVQLKIWSAPYSKTITHYSLNPYECYYSNSILDEQKCHVSIHYPDKSDVKLEPSPLSFVIMATTPNDKTLSSNPKEVSRLAFSCPTVPQMLLYQHILAPYYYAEHDDSEEDIKRLVSSKGPSIRKLERINSSKVAPFYASHAILQMIRSILFFKDKRDMFIRYLEAVANGKKLPLDLDFLRRIRHHDFLFVLFFCVPGYQLQEHSSQHQQEEMKGDIQQIDDSADSKDGLTSIIDGDTLYFSLFNCAAASFCVQMIHSYYTTVLSNDDIQKVNGLLTKLSWPSYEEDVCRELKNLMTTPLLLTGSSRNNLATNPSSIMLGGSGPLSHRLWIRVTAPLVHVRLPPAPGPDTCHFREMYERLAEGLLTCQGGLLELWARAEASTVLYRPDLLHDFYPDYSAVFAILEVNPPSQTRRLSVRLHPPRILNLVPLQVIDSDSDHKFNSWRQASVLAHITYRLIHPLPEGTSEVEYATYLSSTWNNTPMEPTNLLLAQYVTGMRNSVQRVVRKGVNEKGGVQNWSVICEEEKASTSWIKYYPTLWARGDSVTLKPTKYAEDPDKDSVNRLVRDRYDTCHVAHYRLPWFRKVETGQMIAVKEAGLLLGASALFVPSYMDI